MVWAPTVRVVELTNLFGKEPAMLTLPRAADPLVRAFAPCFSDRVFRRFVLLLAGAVLAPRRRCVTSILRVLGPLADGHFSSYHRVLSHARFSTWRLGRTLARLVVAVVPEGEPVVPRPSTTPSRGTAAPRCTAAAATATRSGRATASPSSPGATGGS
jgi:hypothetical protein